MKPDIDPETGESPSDSQYFYRPAPVADTFFDDHSCSEPCGQCGGSPSIHEGHGSFTCRSCFEIQFCTECSYPVHPGSPCRSKSERSAEDRANEALMLGLLDLDSGIEKALELRDQCLSDLRALRKEISMKDNDVKNEPKIDPNERLVCWRVRPHGEARWLYLEVRQLSELHDVLGGIEEGERYDLEMFYATREEIAAWGEFDG